MRTLRERSPLVEEILVIVDGSLRYDGQVLADVVPRDTLGTIFAELVCETPFARHPPRLPPSRQDRIGLVIVTADENRMPEVRTYEGPRAGP
jgi:hypothetical protein